jgi:hypothetical protein
MSKVNNDNRVRVSGFLLGPRERSFLSFCGGVEAQLKFQHGKAIKAFQGALKNDGNFVLAAYEMSWSFAAAGRYREAANCLISVMNKKSHLSDNYQRISRLDFYQREMVEDDVTLPALYEYFRGFSVLQILATNEVAGFSALQSCAQDQYLSPITRESSRGRLKDLADVRAGKPMSRFFIMTIQNMLIIFNQHIMATFEDHNDRRAMETGLLAQMRIVDKLQQWDDDFLAFRKGIKNGLATVYFYSRRNHECRRLVEEVLLEDPENEIAKELSKQLRQFN